MNSIIIYTPKITARNKYVFRLLFEELYLVDYDLVDDIKLYEESDKLRVNYSKSPIVSSEFFIESASLLLEKDITEIDLRTIIINEIPYFFKSNHDLAYLHDVFSATFYLVSRYEEYLPHLKDKYGRYSPTDSILYKLEVLKKPIVNIWLKEFITALTEHYSQLIVDLPRFKYISTIDIDNAYFYKGKGFVRSFALFIKLLMKFNFENIKFAISIFQKKRKDPFDTYSLQFNLNKKYDVNTRYFVLLGDYGLNDKNLSYTNSKLILLVKRIADLAVVGIHSSFGSNKSISILENEIKRLEDIQKREVFSSRQHFIKVSFPETYKRLVELGVSEDFSMGYASVLGFRAGIASPFTFYDLDMEQILPIKIYPFAITDNILKDNLNLRPEDVNNKITDMIREIKEVGGMLVTIWHNDTFSNYGSWKGWKNVYENMVKLIKQ